MRDGRLAGKRAFCTAAGQGIGRETALAFLREGAEVIATDLNPDLLVKLAEDGPGIVTHVLDARDTDAIQAAAKEAGAVDILFNCAGFVHQGTILETTEADWDFSFDLNVKSLWRTLNAFLPGMVENGGGSIVNIGSAASTIKAAPNRAVYSTTKAAVAALTKSVAVDYVKHGIRCNVICPGTVETPSLDDRMKALGGDYAAVHKSFVDRQLMGRLAQPQEIAMLAVYLASDESAFVTGGEHLIDGGWSL
jgi:2-keto-3-deoxy-L-fuconate dehydrogenase